MNSSNNDLECFLEEVDDTELEEDLRACQSFPVDSELKKERHQFFNFGMSAFENFLVNERLDDVLRELKCPAKVNLTFGFVSKNFEDRNCRYFYAHENNTVMEKSKLVCTGVDIENLKERLQKMDIVDVCTRERFSNKGRYYKLDCFRFITQRSTHGM